MKIPVRCAAILAGGASSRMGREKALIEWRGVALIAHIAAVLRPIFPQICVVTSQVEVAKTAVLPLISDQFEARGPLSGIHAALSHFGAPTFVVACDMPFLCADFIEYLSLHFERHALIPEGENGIEPLHAVYDATCLPIFEAHLRAEGKTPSLRRIVAKIGAEVVAAHVVRQFDAQLRCFSNWNTPDDLETGDDDAAT